MRNGYAPHRRLMTEPNGQPVTPTSPVLTALEVAIYVRLVEPEATEGDRQSAIRSVHRLVQDGKLRPIQPGRQYAFWRDEVDRYIREETEAFELKRKGKALTSKTE